MEHIPPLLNIAGTAFIVNVKREKLIQYNDPGNTIPFSAILSVNSGYSLLYNRISRNVWTGSVHYKPDYVIEVSIPPIAQLDPVGISEKFNIPLAEVRSW